MSRPPQVVIVSKSTVHPPQKPTTKPLKLSVSDLPMLSCHYIQKGLLFTQPPESMDDVLAHLKSSLSEALVLFPPLAGRLSTSHDGHVHIDCDDHGMKFIHATAKHIRIHDILSAIDVPKIVKLFFTFDRTISYVCGSKPLAAVQVTELEDGIFIGCSVNHALTDGTSLWHFFNTFSAISAGAQRLTIIPPDFSRDTPFDSPVILPIPAGGSEPTFSADETLRERIFHFSRESVRRLKERANNIITRDETDRSENIRNGTTAENEISSFQALCAQLWRCVTRARKVDHSKTTTFRMAANCRHRLRPKMDPYYFGNAIQSIPTVALAGELVKNDISWSGMLLRRSVANHDDTAVRQGIGEWEKSPRVFPRGNFDGAMITMGSSPRFPMYDNDFGWGRPLAVRSGAANKFDGKISAFPGEGGDGSIDLELVLAPETMAGLESDPEFTHYASVRRF